MSVTGNFTSVMLGADEGGAMKLKINGTSEQPQDVRQVYVAVAHAGAKKALLSTAQKGVPGQLPCASVDAEGAGGWTVVLDQAKPPYKVGEMVLLVGVMVPGNNAPPFSWHETLQIVKG